MSYRYLIDTERKLVTTVFIGRTSAEESITAMSEILKDPAYRPGMNAVTEYSDASGDWSLADLDRLRRFIGSLKEKVGKCYWAVVIPEGKSVASAKLLVTLHNAFDSDIRIKIFRSQDAAREWIDLRTSVASAQ